MAALLSLERPPCPLTQISRMILMPLMTPRLHLQATQIRLNSAWRGFRICAELDIVLIEKDLLLYFRKDQALVVLARVLGLERGSAKDGLRSQRTSFPCILSVIYYPQKWNLPLITLFLVMVPMSASITPMLLRSMVMTIWLMFGDMLQCCCITRFLWRSLIRPIAASQYWSLPKMP